MDTQLAVIGITCLILWFILSLPVADDEEGDSGYHIPSVRTVLKRVRCAINRVFNGRD